MNQFSCGFNFEQKETRNLFPAKKDTFTVILMVTYNVMTSLEGS